MKYILALLLLVTAAPLCSRLNASDNSAGTPGTLYVLVDQTATIYLNGANINLPKKDPSAQVTLHTGDRLVVKMSSTHYYRHLALLFVSADKQSEISFRTACFKLLPDPETTDFTEAQFNDFPKGVTPIDRLMKQDYVAKIEKKPFPYPNNSEFFWGDRPECAVGTLITDDMFSPMAP